VITRETARLVRAVRVAQIMGTAVSIHVIHDRTLGTKLGARIDDVAEATFADVREADRRFSTYRPDSDIRRIARGELAIATADASVCEVAAACDLAHARTGGRFSAHWRGWFDPTGYVKGWAVETAARRWLLPLAAQPGIVAVGVNAGGDMQVFTNPGANWTWRIGIADPAHPGTVLATLDLRDGAVATSGTAERGEHIVDPRTGRAARGVASATVVADGLADADVWATAAVVGGFDHLEPTLRQGTRGIIVATDGRIRRWIDQTEVAVSDAARTPVTIA
jgi:thiamine biosynthesis lipoprotein